MRNNSCKCFNKLLILNGQLLKECSIPEEHIIFLNIVSAPEGIERVFSTYPSIRIVTCALDDCLNEDKYIVPVRLPTIHFAYNIPFNVKLIIKHIVRIMIRGWVIMVIDTSILLELKYTCLLC